MGDLEDFREHRKDPDYLAFNGHMMRTTQWTATGRRIQWSAIHSPKCQCNGEELPDE